MTHGRARQSIKIEAERAGLPFVSYWIGESHRVLDDGHHTFCDLAAHHIIAAERHWTGWERPSAREPGQKGEVALTWVAQSYILLQKSQICVLKKIEN